MLETVFILICLLNNILTTKNKSNNSNHLINKSNSFLKFNKKIMYQK